ncbi:MAG: nicotinate-nucleotide adenylyltransferase [Candidatus Saccharimonas sp.]|nr:nicotinate-nucleotide adenylyltransferase [Planctomycetaceae bacterium]
MRLGIYGGTFDPIHYGHLVLAEQCREQCQLDEVWFVPAAQPPHKLDATISSAKARCEMVEFAIAGHPHFKLSRMEIERTGPSFTVTTLEQLREEDASRELFLLIGADSLHDLPQWREPQRIQQLATVVAVNRGDRPLPDRSRLEQQLGPAEAARIQFVQMPGLDLSAGDIRQRSAEERSIRYLVPRAVEVYIAHNHLYSTRAS